MIYIVYCTTNIINKKIYIGVHKCTSSKFDGYLGCGVYENKPSTYQNPKQVFQYAVKKYGPSNFKRITIKEFQEEEEAYDFEAEIVNEDFLKRKDVYNIALGGKGGDITGMGIPCYQYDLEGNFVAEYTSQQDAARAVNRSYSPIKIAIKKKTKSANFYWSLEKVEKLDLSQYKTTDNKIPVFQYSETGEYDCCYESVSDAARVLNTESTIISRAIKLGYLTNGKYLSSEFFETYVKKPKGNNKKLTVYQYTLEGEYLREFESCNQAEKYLGVAPGLSKALRLGRTFAGFQWSTVKLDSLSSRQIQSSARKVGQYDLDGNLIAVFDTVTECTKKFSGCRRVLHGKGKTSGGYVFKYLE